MLAFLLGTSYHTVIAILLAVGLLGWFLHEKIWHRNHSISHLATSSKNYTISYRRRALRYGLLFLSLIAIALSLYPPFSGLLPSGYSSIQNNNIIVAFDVSKSMNVLDTGNGVSRLEFAKTLASKFILQHPKNTYSIVAIAGDTIIISPPTQDTESILQMIPSISSSSVGNGGSDFSKAIPVIESLSITENPDQKVLALVFSDGMESSDIPAEGSLSLAFEKTHTPYIAIGIGSIEGWYIPDGHDFFGNTVFKRFQGELVKSVFFEEWLKRIAKASHGAFVRIPPESTQVDADLLTKAIQPLSHSEGQSSAVQIPLAFFFFLFIGFLLIPDRFPVWRNV